MDIVLFTRKKRFVDFAFSVDDDTVRRYLTSLFENYYVVDYNLACGHTDLLPASHNFDRRRGYKRQLVECDFRTYLLYYTYYEVDDCDYRKQHILDLPVEDKYHRGKEYVDDIKQREYVGGKYLEIGF